MKQGSWKTEKPPKNWVFTGSCNLNIKSKVLLVAMIWNKYGFIEDMHDLDHINNYEINTACWNAEKQIVCSLN